MMLSIDIGEYRNKHVSLPQWKRQRDVIQGQMDGWLVGQMVPETEYHSATAVCSLETVWTVLLWLGVWPTRRPLCCGETMGQASLGCLSFSIVSRTCSKIRAARTLCMTRWNLNNQIRVRSSTVMPKMNTGARSDEIKQSNL